MGSFKLNSSAYIHTLISNMKLLAVIAVLPALTLSYHHNPFYKRKNCPKSYIEQQREDLFSKQYMDAAMAKGYERVWQGKCQVLDKSKDGECLTIWNTVLKQMSDHKIAKTGFFKKAKPVGNKYCEWESGLKDKIQGYCLTPCDSEQPVVLFNKNDGTFIFRGPVHEVKSGKSKSLIVTAKWTKGKNGNLDAYTIVDNPTKEDFWAHHNCRVPPEHTAEKNLLGVCRIFKFLDC